MAESQDQDEFERQNPEVRRQIRMKYRVFLDELQDNKEDLINPESDQLRERLKEADELFKPVKNTREAVLDSQAMSMIAQLGRMKAQALHTEFVRFQPVEFTEKLKAYVDGRTTQSQDSRISARGWESLGKATQPYYRKAPTFTFMCGSFERGPKPVKEKQKAARVKDSVVGKETVPQQLKNFSEAENKETTTEEVVRVLDILRDVYEREGGNPLCFYEFVLNPHSYGQTIENIFHVSFLIRDGLAEILLDDDHLPVIRPLDKGETEPNQPQTSNVKRHQTVHTITLGEWKQLIEVYHVEEATIPSTDTLANGDHSQSNGHT